MREKELLGKDIKPLGWVGLWRRGDIPLKARGWMGGPLGYSQPWKFLVYSRDANCLQPDTFLDPAEGAKRRVSVQKHLQFPGLRAPNV